MSLVPNSAEIEAFVCQSQLIEGIGYDEGDPRSANHALAVREVLEMFHRQDSIDAKRIHEVLMDGIMDDAGEYRKGRCCIVNGRGEVLKDLPLPQHIPYLMNMWLKRTEIFLNSSNSDKDNLEKSCLLFYYHFLCIHPFSDGNGRTGRLLHNLLRLRLGLPWFTFTTDMHPLYVRKLQKYEVGFQTIFALYY